MKYIGAHVASLPLVSDAPEEARRLGATAFAFNLIDPQKWNYPPYEESDVELFRKLCADYGFTSAQILPHSAFTVNLCSPEARKLSLSRRTFVDEMKRCSQLGLGMLNFHPGAHLNKIEEDESLRLVAESINYALERTEGVTAVIENTAGQGSNIGFSFRQLARIIEGVNDKSRVGVCIDSCHASAAGYELSSADSYDATWGEFSSTIGFEFLRGMHINDAMRATGSRIDRHASIGKGTIGIDFFRRLMQDPRFDGIPMILETPDPTLWPEEIHLLQRMAQQEKDNL